MLTRTYDMQGQHRLAPVVGQEYQPRGLLHCYMVHPNRAAGRCFELESLQCGIIIVAYQYTASTHMTAT